MRRIALWVFLSIPFIGCGGDGPFPADPEKVSAVPISYQDRDRGPTTVTAFPGEVRVWMREGTPPAEFPILAELPEVGYYLLAVASGSEADVIDRLNADPNVADASPHVVAHRAGAALIGEECETNHGQAVRDVVTRYGGKVDSCRKTHLWKGNPAVNPTLVGIYAETKEKKGETTLINVSTAGGVSGFDFANADLKSKEIALADWEKFVKELATLVSRLPEEAREDLVITLAAGNENMPIDDLLTGIRKNPELDRALLESILIVTSDQYYAANWSAGERDVAVVSNPESYMGTSYAAPYANALLQRVMQETGAKAKIALKAIKQAVAKNPKHQLVLAEAIAQAKLILSNPAGDATIQLVSDTEKTIGQLAPALDGVAVSYLINGTDGHHGSGTLISDLTGRVTLPLPQGYYSDVAPTWIIPGSTWLKAEYSIRVEIASTGRYADTKITRHYLSPLSGIAFGWNGGNVIVGQVFPTAAGVTLSVVVTGTDGHSYSSNLTTDILGQFVILLPTGLYYEQFVLDPTKYTATYTVFVTNPATGESRQLVLYRLLSFVL